MAPAGEGVPQELPPERRQAAVGRCLALLLLGQEMPALDWFWQVRFRRIALKESVDTKQK